MEGNSRRDFLKKAGVAAWTVPAVQIVNMTGALAGDVNVSVVTTTTPPTTRPPDDCVNTVVYRLKAEPGRGGWTWVTGEGKNDCITGGYDPLIPDGLPVYIDGDTESVKVWHKLDGCSIIEASHKAGSPNQGQACFPAAGDGQMVVFTAQPKEISHIELLVECCVDDN